jgi:hypothetical protein
MIDDDYWKERSRMHVHFSKKYLERMALLDNLNAIFKYC